MRSFNPRPALGPGATFDAGQVDKFTKVSILARLWGRALHMLREDSSLMLRVSILARLWGRALQDDDDFKSDVIEVSILARLWGRALLSQAL